MGEELEGTARERTPELPARVDVVRPSGLTEEEAARRLAREGPNELPASKRRGPFRIALEVVKEPMFLLLIACGSSTSSSATSARPSSSSASSS